MGLWHGHTDLVGGSVLGPRKIYLLAMKDEACQGHVIARKKSLVALEYKNKGYGCGLNWMQSALSVI